MGEGDGPRCNVNPILIRDIMRMLTPESLAKPVHLAYTKSRHPDTRDRWQPQTHPTMLGIDHATTDP